MQDMEKPIPRRQSAIGPFYGVECPQKLSPPCEGITGRFNGFDLLVEPCRHGDGSKFGSHHTGRFEQHLIFRGELLELPLEQLQDARRYAYHSRLYAP
jgi:hypothetical protein